MFLFLGGISLVIVFDWEMIKENLLFFLRSAGKTGLALQGSTVQCVINSCLSSAELTRPTRSIRGQADSADRF